MRNKHSISVLAIMFFSMMINSAIAQYSDPSNNIPVPPDPARPAGAAMRNNLYWIGVDGNYAFSNSGENGASVIREMVPDLAMIGVGYKPELFSHADYYTTNNIPTLIQNFGNGYLDFFTANNAFEINWRGVDLGIESSSVPLAGTAHAVAVTSDATEYAFAKVIESSIKSGYSGFGFQDMVWMWDGERGRNGYNPSTLTAFRNALNGLDAGFEVQFGGGTPMTYHFAEYADYYFGGIPTPSDLGISSWDDFPFTYVQYSLHSADEKTRHDALFDLLCHYEWLRYAHRLGSFAELYGGFFQNLTNPEYFCDGVDHLFASSLTNVHAITIEFFGTPKFLDGAYFHFDALSDLKSVSTQLGVVMEQGSGGNGATYWQPESAYTSAYELSLATQADHFEGDFWPGSQADISYLITNSSNKSRILTLMGFGVGYKHACEDNFTRMDGDFVSISSRYLFRGLNSGWHPWEWYLDHNKSPESLLASEGYIFDGRSEESLYTMELPESVVVYSPVSPTEKGWNYLKNLLNLGSVGRVISSAVNFEDMITDDLNIVPFSSMYSVIDFIATSNGSGTLSWDDPAIATTTDSYSVSGTHYALPAGSSFVPVAWIGGKAIVASKTYGGGDLVMLLFDPTESGNESLAAAVYAGLFSQNNIAPRWQSLSGGGVVRIYNDDASSMVVVGVHNEQARTTRNASDQWPYDTAGVTTQVKVDLGVASGAFNYVALPCGVRGSVSADGDGFVTLSFQDTGHEIFYLLPSGVNQEPLDAIFARKAEIENVFLLNGRIKSGNDSNVTFSYTSGDAVPAASVYMRTNDAIQDLLPVVTDYQGNLVTTSAAGGSYSLTDAITTTSPTFSYIPTDTTPVYFTWDLGGTSTDALTRELDSVTIWVQGGSLGRLGFNGQLYTSVDGNIFTPLLVANYVTDFDATSSNDLNGAYKLRFSFADESVKNFRYFRILSANGGQGIRQPAYIEIDVMITTAVLGDITGDGRVDVGDLGVLAANYGRTGMTLSQGDLTGDGVVDVGDLGILAANYGTGVSGDSDFDADYKAVFGDSDSESANESADENEIVDTLCSSVGLPLIAGLLLAGLMLVKLKCQ